MRELPSVGEIIKQHFPLTRSNKRWSIAPKKTFYHPQSMQNAALETEYHRVINIVKSLYLQHGEVYFERDYKRDKRDGLFGMHSFLTSTLYWRLDCSFCYDYEITLAFNNCPFEAEIRKLMRAYPLDRGVRETQLQPDFGTYYHNVVRIQEPHFLHSLKGT